MCSKMSFYMLCLLLIDVLYKCDRYASAPQQARNNWDEFTRDYFLNRSSLVSVFLLIDASIPAKQVDLEYARWLGENKVTTALVHSIFLRFFTWWQWVKLN